MPRLSEQVKVDLDECRMLVLGTQVLISLQYESAFETAYAELPRFSKRLLLIALVLLLIAFTLLVWIPAYHRIVLDGDCTRAFRRFSRNSTSAALAPLLIALSADVFIGANKVRGLATGIAAGAASLLVAGLFWYGIGLISRRSRAPEQHMNASQQDEQDCEHPPLHERVSQVLTEARVVLPGAQAMLGFQFITMLMHGFDTLPASSKDVHLVCLGLIAITVMLLIAPAAFHRIAEDGQDSERLVRVSSRLILAALVFLAMGMSGDLFVVARKITGSDRLGTIVSIAMLLLFLGLWFGYTAFRRVRSER